MFKDKILLITGGTGSFGNAVLRKFLNTNIKLQFGTFKLGFGGFFGRLN